MSVLLIDANEDGKYELTKDELQALLNKVEREAFERGVAFFQTHKFVECEGDDMNALKGENRWIRKNGIK